MFATDENSNYAVTVHNETGSQIILSYLSCSGSGAKTFEREAIEPSDIAEAHVCGSQLDERQITINLDGIEKRYDISPDYWGHDDLYIERADFIQ